MHSGFERIFLLHRDFLQDSAPFCHGQGTLPGTPLLFQALEAPTGHHLLGPGPPIEHLPTRCLYAGSGSPCDAEATWLSTAKWDKIFLLCGLHSGENIIKHGCFTMFRQI